MHASQEQDVEGKIFICELLKNKGNLFYSEKNIQNAIDQYLHGVAIFRYYDFSQGTYIGEEHDIGYLDEAQKKEVQTLLAALFRNLAACYKTQNKIKKTIKYLDESIELEPFCDKTWFKRYQALESQKVFHLLPEAIDCLELAIKFSKNKNMEGFFHKHLQDVQMKYVLQMNKDSALDSMFMEDVDDELSLITEIGKKTFEMLRDHRATKIWNS